MVSLMLMAAGPITTTKSAGKIQNTIGIIIFTGSGSTARRVSTALAAAQALQAPTPSTALSLTRAPVGSAAGRDEDDAQGRLKMRSWGCEKCSDPICEHRLFTSLRLAATR